MYVALKKVFIPELKEKNMPQLSDNGISFPKNEKTFCFSARACKIPSICCVRTETIDLFTRLKSSNNPHAPIYDN